MIRRTPLPLLASLLVLAAAGCDTDSDAAPAADSVAVAPAPAADTAAMPSDDGALLDPGSASREELTATGTLDSAAAEALIAARPFANMLAVDSALAPHMSESEREAAYRRIWQPIDLNNASAEEILLIPGVGPRMQHEFEEYRPYTSMDQFRREIGKYVDEDEVARLERYVVLR